MLRFVRKHPERLKVGRLTIPASSRISSAKMVTSSAFRASKHPGGGVDARSGPGAERLGQAAGRDQRDGRDGGFGAERERHERQEPDQVLRREHLPERDDSRNGRRGCDDERLSVPVRACEQDPDRQDRRERDDPGAERDGVGGRPPARFREL